MEPHLTPQLPPSSPESKKTPAWRLLIESGLSKQAKVIYMILWLRWNPGRKQQCNPSFRSISDDSGCNEDDVGKHVKTLEREGWIGVSRGRKLSKEANQYQLLNGEGSPLPNKWAFFARQTVSEGFAHQTASVSLTKRRVQGFAPKGAKIKKGKGGATHTPDPASQSGSGAAKATTVLGQLDS